MFVSMMMGLYLKNINCKHKTTKVFKMDSFGFIITILFANEMALT
jgi:hypothetical protein